MIMMQIKNHQLQQSPLVSGIDMASVGCVF